MRSKSHYLIICLILILTACSQTTPQTNTANQTSEATTAPKATSTPKPTNTPLPVGDEFSSEAGNFTILLPVEPIEQTVPDPDFDEVEVRVFVTLVENGKASYTVSYRDYPEVFVGVIQQDLDFYFESITEEALSVLNGTIVSQTDISVNGFPGYQTIFDIPDSVLPGGGQGISRTYLVGTRRYDMAGLMVTGYLPDGEIEAMLDTFQLINPPDTAEIEAPLEAVTLSEWLEFSSDAGNFTILLPTKPVEETNSFMSVIGQLDQYLFTATQNNGVQYLISYADVPGMLFVTNEKLVKDTLDDGQDGNLSAINGISISEADITLGEFSGKQVEFEFTDVTFPTGGEGISQVYLVGNKMYNLLVLAPEGELIAEEANHFFESFQLLETPTLAQTTWQAFSPENGDFSLLFPTTPAEAGDAYVRMLVVREGESTYMLQYGEVPTQYQTDVEGFLDLAATNLPKEVNGTVIKENSLVLGDNPGRELMFEFTNNKYRAGGIQEHRFYVVDNTFYDLIIEGPQVGYPAERAAQFLDSFQIESIETSSTDNQTTNPNGADQAFVSEEGAFSIIFPEQPETKEQVIIDDSGQLEGYLFVVSPSTEATYSVTYADSPQDFSLMDEAGIEAELDSLRDHFAGNWATVLSEKDIQLNDTYPGRHVEIEITGVPESGAILQFFLVGNRIYEVIVFEPKESLNTEPVNQFLNSFQLTGELTTPTEWQRFISGEGNFSVLFPEQPTIQQNSVPSSLGTLEVHLFMVYQSPIPIYSVSYFNHTEDFSVLDEATIKNHLDGTRDDTLESLNAIFVTEKDISLGDYPGRQIEFDLNPATFGIDASGILQVYLVNSRVYQLTVFESKENLHAENIIRFLNSFQLADGTSPTVSD